MGGRSRTRNGLGVGIAVALTVVAVVAVTPSQSVVAGPPVGGVWVVNSAGDASDLAIDGNCNVGGDVCTLRAALAEAEAEFGLTTDAAADIRIEVAPSDPILVGAEMLVSVEVGDMLTIGAAVPPADRPVLDGGGSDRIFNFSGGGRINLNGLILQNGSELDASGGGAILTDSELWLDRVTVRDSDSTNTGGAVFSTALLDIKFSEFTGNNAFLGGAIRGMAWTRINDTIISGNDGQQGGGIYIESVLDIADSLVIDNGATNGGGGIFCSCSNANVVRTSLIRNVTAGGTGGGMYAEAYFGGPPFFVRVDNSTFFQNFADVDGSGLLVETGGEAVLINVTIADNSSTIGSGLSASNFAGATHSMTNSIVYGNTGLGGAANDCSTFDYATAGTTSFIAAGGCVPQGGGTRPNIDPGPLTEGQFGGGVNLGPFDVEPTVLAISATSPALDAGTCVGSIPVDARFVKRNGPACDIGAFELTLAAGGFRDDGDGSFGPPSGVVDFGSVRIPVERLSGAVLSDPAGNGSLDQPSAVPQAQIHGIDLEQTGLAAVPLRQIALDAIPLDAEVLDAISLDQIPLDYTSTNGDGWSAYLLDNGLTDLAAQPLNTVTLAQVLAATANLGPEAELDVGQIDFSETPLGSLPVGAMALGGTSLADIATSGDDTPVDWCALIAPYTTKTCGTQAGTDINPNTATLVSISLQGVPLRQIPLRQIPLRQIDLSAAPLRQIPLRQIDIEASPLRQIPLRQIFLTSTPLRQIPLRQIDIQGSPLRQIPLRQILLTSTPLRQIPLRQINLDSSPLRQIPLRQIANLSSIVDCSSFTGCGSQTSTLGDVPTASLIGTLGALLIAVPDTEPFGTLGEIGGPEYPDAYGAVGATVLATLGELEAYFGDTTLGEIGGPGFPDAYGDMTIADLLALLIQLFPDTTLGELLAGILPASEMPWQDIDLEAGATAFKQAVAPAGTDDTSIKYDVTIDSTLPTGTPIEIELSVPDGYTLLPGSFELKPIIPDNICCDELVPAFDFPVPTIGPDDRAGRTLAEMTVTPPLDPADAAFRVVFRAVPPLELGQQGPFEIEVTAPSWGVVDQQEGVEVIVDDILENNDTFDQSTSFIEYDNDVDPPIALNDVDDILFLTHINQATDVDWFTLPVEQGDQLSVFLSNLPADYDVLLFGPAQAQLRGAPARTLAPSPDGGRSLLGEDNAVNADLGGDVDTTPGAQDMQLYGVSSRRGTTSERIDTGALPAGTYYIKVAGYNGASSASPYSLRARTSATEGAGTCAAIPPPPVAPPLPSSVTTITNATTTILLTHLGRLRRSYPIDATVARDALTAFVNEVNAAPADFAGTSAAVVTLDDLSAYTGWDSAPCDPATANAVVSQIGARIDSIRDQFPNVTNVVLVGADDQIPFARVKDGVPAHNESEYAPTFDGNSPLTAALSLGYVLSDNPYASSNPLAVGPRELFVPEVGIGRLVESPSDVAEALGNFTDFNGELDPQTALSTGYDFLTDGADAVADELIAPDGRFGAASVERLNNDAWTRSDLRQAWLGTSTADAADLVSVNAHFDHYRALPADQDAAGLLTDPFDFGDVTGSADGSLDGSIVFSMGCHMGLSVSDISVAGALSDDWAQVLSSEGAIVAGNTGYGYGDDTVVGATEELMRQFALRLDGSMTVGQAMAFAKQQYTADLLVVSPFDEKVVSQVVFYGLPMYRLVDGQPVQPVVNPPTTVDPVTGLDSLPVTVSTPIAAGALEPNSPAGGNGTYYAVAGEIQATPYQPVQPRTSRDVTQPGETARGALLTGLTSVDVGLPNPAIMTPTDDVTGSNPEARVDGAFFPSALQSIGRRQDVTGPRDQLVIVPGQFRDDPASATGGGVQRLFTSTSAIVYYAPGGNGDVTPPTIDTTSAAIIGGSAVFSVRAHDDAAVSRVNVLFSSPSASPATPRIWRSVDLALSGALRSGAAPVPGGTTAIDYFVQVVDSGGNVSVGSDKGVNHSGSALIAPPPLPTAPTITLPATGTPGHYTGDVTVTIVPSTPGDPINTRVDGGAPTSDLELIVSGPGMHTVESTSSDGAPATVTFFIGSIVAPPTPPAVSAMTTPVPASGWFVAAPTVTISGAAGSTPVASIRYRIGATGSFTTVNGATAQVVINAQGVSTVEYFAVDGNGLESAHGTIDVRRDSVAPTITLTTPAAGATYTIGQVVNAAYGCADASGASGLAAVDGCTGTKAPGQAIDTATAGTKSFTVTTKDVAGNTTSITRSYSVVPSFVPMSGSTFTTQPGGVLKFTSSASKPLGSFAWLSGPGGRTGTVSGPLTFTTTGTASGRGFGVMVGTYQTSGIVLTGLSVQFDPGYDCGTKSAGSKIGSLVIQRWVAVPITAVPEACTAAPVDLYPGSNNTQKTNAAKADRNARYWSKPMTIQVTMQPGILPGTTKVTGSATSAGPTGQPRTITVSTTVLTVTLGPSWGLRAFGDTAGTFTPTVSVS